MAVSKSLRTWVLSEESIPSVIGGLIEMNDQEKLRTLVVVFDRVGGVHKLVNAFKSFVTVSAAVISTNRFSHDHRSESLKSYATLLKTRRWLSCCWHSSPMPHSHTHPPYRLLPSPKTSNMRCKMPFLTASKSAATNLRRGSPVTSTSLCARVRVLPATNRLTNNSIRPSPCIASQQTRTSSARSIIAPLQSVSCLAVAPATMRKRPCLRSSKRVRISPLRGCSPARILK